MTSGIAAPSYTPVEHSAHEASKLNVYKYVYMCMYTYICVYIIYIHQIYYKII